MATSSIINAVFGSSLCAVTTSAYRANYGMVLRFSGIALPTAFEVDFSNYDVMGRDSITAIGQNNEVQIPDDLWESGLNIYAYVYLHPTDDSGVTVYTVTIPVLGRPNRTEETPTPHEQSVIEQAISALNDAVEQTAADVETTTANAQAAASSEANAATSERSAAASAGAAAESASEAQASAEQAEQSAQSISGDAERAEQAATTATNKATEAASSASSAASAAQNAASSEQSAQSHATDAETAKQDAQDAQAAAETAAESVSGLSAQITQNTADIAELVQSKAGALIDTASGSIASFYPDSTVPTVRGLTVNVEPVQSGTGDPSPDNIRPISGWDAVEVDRTGVNVWDEEWEVGDYNIYTGAKTNDSSRIRSKNFIPVSPNTTYFFNTATYKYVLEYDVEQNYIGVNSNTSPNSRFTTGDNTRFITFYLINRTTYNHDISINYPSTDTAYHSGKDNATYTIQLGQTVYGGKLDVTGGKMVVDRAMFTFTGAERFIENTAWGAYARLHNTGVAIQSSVSKERTISSHFKKSSSGGWGSLTAGLFMTAGGTFIGIGFDGSISELQAYLASQYSAGTPVQVVALLATPITVDLTPIEVAVLTGQTNNVWADSGDVSVEYAADLKTYINNKIAAAVAALS